MNNYIELPPDRRKLLCEEAQMKIGLPPEDQMTAWRQDYNATVENMFFGEIPGFDEVLKVIGDFERRFNAG